jgi:hypothetical protein
MRRVHALRQVTTIGKDMTFRDFSQGTFRMRGIASGQKIHLYIIPEVCRGAWGLM